MHEHRWAQKSRRSGIGIREFELELESESDFQSQPGIESESGFQSQPGIKIRIRLSESPWNRNQEVVGIVHHWVTPSNVILFTSMCGIHYFHFFVHRLSRKPLPATYIIALFARLLAIAPIIQFLRSLFSRNSSSSILTILPDQHLPKTKTISTYHVISK